MTRREQIIAFLEKRGGEGATNAEIVLATGIRHVKVFQITQALVASGKLRARRLAMGATWHFIWRPNAE
jgi:DNA-binding IclR family transcriptional regulator